MDLLKYGEIKRWIMSRGLLNYLNKDVQTSMHNGVMSRYNSIVRIITNSDYFAHTEPICKKLRILKISDMFSVALWKFYYKLMNNKLPAYFSFMKPVLPIVTERYEIRNPSFHTPAIKHKFAECSLQYCLINQLNSENSFALLTDKVNLNSFYSFKVFVKSRIPNSYQH